MRITRRLEFDAGHRIPDHASQCRHLHGHRYAIEITLEGGICNTPGSPENGMVMDFSEVKNILATHVVEPWDHAFLAYAGDQTVVNFLATLSDHKTVLLPVIPTAENLAKTAFTILERAFTDRYGSRLKLIRVRLFETPNCWADAISNNA